MTLLVGSVSEQVGRNYRLLEKEAGASKIQSIRWTLNHFPPYMILTDGLPGKGAAAELVHYAIKQLPGYQHTVEMASFPSCYRLDER